jgi:hypothetical protein
MEMAGVEGDEPDGGLILHLSLSLSLALAGRETGDKESDDKEESDDGSKAVWHIYAVEMK